MSRLARSDAGVTLVELLVVVAITATIVPSLTGALIIGWRTTDSTIASLSDTRNREIGPSLFTRDAQAGNSVDTATADTTCVSPGDTLLVRFRWTETPATGGPLSRVAAWVWTGPASQLVERRYCATGVSVTSSVTTAHAVATAPAGRCRASAGAVNTIPCGTAPVIELTISDASGDYMVTGRRRVG